MQTDNYYDAHKHKYMDYANDKFAEYVFSFIDKHQQQRKSVAIEFGAGMGRFSSPLIKRYERVVLVEPAKAYADGLEAKYSAANVQVEQLTVNQFLRNSDIAVDADIYCFHLMHHLSEAERGELFEYISKGNKTAWLIEPNPYNLLIALQIALNPDMHWDEECQLFRLTHKRYSQELSKYGARVVKHQYACVLPPALLNVIANVIDARFIRFAEVVARLLPFTASYQLLKVEVA